MSTRQTAAPETSVFSRTVPIIIERHYFGEYKSASTSLIDIHKTTPDEPDADKRMIALTKRLLASPEVNAIRNRDEAFNQYIRMVATPFRPGVYLVPVGLVEQVYAEARKWETERNELADAAAEAYPKHVEAMRVPLGPLFNDADYPPKTVFRAAFWISYRFVDFGAPSVLQTIRADIFEREREKVAAQAAQARSIIEQHAAGMLLKITEHLVETLQPRANGKKPRVTDKALDRLFQFLDTAALRDVTNFRELQAVTTRLRRVAQGLSVEQLRSDSDLRARVASQIEEAKEAVAQLVEEGDRRAIRIRSEVA
jgi:hypothetical protein